MPKFMFHMVAAAAAGALTYASIPIEAETRAEAAEQLEAKLKSGEIKPSFSDATSPIETAEGEKVYMAGVETEDTDGDGKGGSETWPGQKGSPGGTSPSGGSVPLNNSAAPSAMRNVRNMAPLEMQPISGSSQPPAKMRPGEHPIAKGGDPDPSKSPTPGVDGVTHVPLAQRSFATPTPGRTLGALTPGQATEVDMASVTGEDAHKLARERNMSTLVESNAQAPTGNTGGPSPAMHVAARMGGGQGPSQEQMAQKSETDAKLANNDGKTATGEGQGDLAAEVNNGNNGSAAAKAKAKDKAAAAA